MRRHTHATGARAVAGRNHEGRKVHKSYLGPTGPGFDPGSTRARKTGSALAAKGAARVSCCCQRSYVDVPLDELLEGRTRSCGSRRCDALAARGAAS